MAQWEYLSNALSAFIGHPDFVDMNPVHCVLIGVRDELTRDINKISPMCRVCACGTLAERRGCPFPNSIFWPVEGVFGKIIEQVTKGVVLLFFTAQRVRFKVKIWEYIAAFFVVGRFDCMDSLVYTIHGLLHDAHEAIIGDIVTPTVSRQRKRQKRLIVHAQVVFTH